MQPTRNLANAAGEAHYFTGKPCKYGHMAKRYASSGACFECTKMQSAVQVANRVASRRIRNAKLMGDQTQWAATIPLAWHQTFTQLREVVLRGTEADKTILLEIVQLAHGAIGRPILGIAINRERILAVVRHDNERITNIEDFAIREVDDEFYLLIGKGWYRETAIMEVIAGVYPVAYAAQLDK